MISTCSTIIELDSLYNDGRLLSFASRWIRWADSLIGVNGFFISWAILLATSRHAAIFCACDKSVTSSNIRTLPKVSPVLSTITPAVQTIWYSRPSDLIVNSVSVIPELNSSNIKEELFSKLISLSAICLSKISYNDLLPLCSPAVRFKMSDAAVFTAISFLSLLRVITPTARFESTVSIKRRWRSVSFFDCFKSESIILNERLK